MRKQPRKPQHRARRVLKDVQPLCEECFDAMELDRDMVNITDFTKYPCIMCRRVRIPYPIPTGLVKVWTKKMITRRLAIVSVFNYNRKHFGRGVIPNGPKPWMVRDNEVA